MPATMRNLMLAALFSAPALAQVASLQISMSPGDGVGFVVDGAPFQGSATFLWPQGSKHTIGVQPSEIGNTPRAQYTFVNWTINGSVPANFSGATLIISADPSLLSIVANFNTVYEFDLIYFSCPTDGSPCLSPGTVYVNNIPYIQTTSLFLAAGSPLNVVVQPNAGYIFTGWSTSPGSGNSSQAFVNTFTLNKPLEVYPQFYLSRPVNIGVSTAPVALQVLADHTPIGSPANLDWGTGTVHAVSVASPQIDGKGGTWVFSSWSDGGAQNHNYTVPDGYGALSLTAQFLPSYRITFATSPPSLTLNINGRSNWPSLTFSGATGTQYQVSAPASQVDSQGRINQFVSWSNGGTETQTYAQPGNDDHLTATYQTLGHLTLISNPPGLSLTVNGAACVSPCGFDQAPGTQMKISVPASIPLTASSRLDFQGWQDSTAASRVYTMTSALQVLSASYQTMFLVAGSVAPAAAGLLLVQPVSADGFYPANTQLQASVSQNPGFQFHAWQGDVGGSQAAVTLNVSSPKTFAAVFAPVPYLPRQRFRTRPDQPL